VWEDRAVVHPIRALLGALQGLAARSRLLVRLATKVRNQANAVIARSLSDGNDPATNGEYRLLDALAPASRVFVDVGANVGKHTARFLARAPADARVLAFEPSESAAAELQRRFAGDPRVEIVDAACGARAGTAEFHEEPAGGVRSSLVPGRSAAGATVRRVPVVALDDVCASRGIDRIDLLKIDAEGADALVLEGASGLLARRAVRVVQFEYDAPWAVAGRTLGGAVAHLDRHGYETLVLRRDGARAVDVRGMGEFASYANFVAVARGGDPTIRSEVEGR
jgi:FkbM family methyltransferase